MRKTSYARRWREAAASDTFGAVTLRLLTLEEVARNTRRTIATVRYWVQTRRLPSVRVGRRRMVHLGDLERFVSVRTAEPKPLVFGDVADSRTLGDVRD